MLLHTCLYLKIRLHIYKIKEILELFFITIVELELERKLGFGYLKIVYVPFNTLFETSIS